MVGLLWSEFYLSVFQRGLVWYSSHRFRLCSHCCLTLSHGLDNNPSPFSRCLLYPIDGEAPGPGLKSSDVSARLCPPFSQSAISGAYECFAVRALPRVQHNLVGWLLNQW